MLACRLRSLYRAQFFSNILVRLRLQTC